MDNTSGGEVEPGSLRPEPISEAEQDRLSDLAHETSVEVVKAIGEIRLRESDPNLNLALALIDSKDKDEKPYILDIINQGMLLAKERLSKTWTTEELVPVKPLPNWDPKGHLNTTMTYQQKNHMVEPTPRLLSDVMMINVRPSPITLAEAVLRQKNVVRAKIDTLLGKPQPSQEEVMAKVVDAYAYDMSIYFRREMQKPQAPTITSSPEEQVAAEQTLKNLGRRSEVRV